MNQHQRYRTQFIGKSGWKSSYLTLLSENSWRQRWAGTTELESWATKPKQWAEESAAAGDCGLFTWPHQSCDLLCYEVLISDLTGVVFTDDVIMTHVLTAGGWFSFSFWLFLSRIIFFFPIMLLSWTKGRPARWWWTEADPVVFTWTLGLFSPSFSAPCHRVVDLTVLHVSDDVLLLYAPGLFFFLCTSSAFITRQTQTLLFSALHRLSIQTHLHPVHVAVFAHCSLFHVCFRL